MRNSNLFTLRGRTTADIVLKHTANEVPFCNFTLAVDRAYRKDAQRETDFFYLTAYRGTAEFLARNTSKGTALGVSGELRVRQWEDEQGNHRSHVDLIADDVEFAGAKQRAGEETAKESGVSEDAAASQDDDDLPF